MKKLLVIVFCALFLLPSLAFGVAGTVTITTNSVVPTYVEQIIFTCVGGTAGDAGTIPNTAITQQHLAKITGMYLYSVTADPGGTAPDAADVFILNQRSEDLLGSADNVTAVNGLNLIHATLTRSTLPRLSLPGSNFYPLIDGLLTLVVANQATASAEWVITLTFVK